MTTRDTSCTQLISLATHELRTPVGVVGGYLRMLARDPDRALNERHRKMIDEAEKSCARLVALIAELSDIAKLDAGLIAIGRQPLDLFELIEEVANTVHEAEDREVRLEVRGPSRGTSLVGDATRLRAAFEAIFRAILRETPGPAIIVADRRLADERGSSSAVLVVADAARVQAAYGAPRDPFDEKRGGLGLALPLARRVIEAHGGRLWSPLAANRANSGSGPSTALVVFPLAEVNP
jgi:signal transduction histidine kinase